MEIKIKRGVGRPRAIEKKSSMDTRDEILHISADLFFNHGFKGTTTRMIADAVGIKQPSLFNHFRKKEDILETLIKVASDDFFEYAENIDFSGDDWKSSLFDLVKFDVKFLMNDSFGINKILAMPEVKNGRLQALVEEKSNKALDYYRRILKNGRDAGQFAFEDIDIAATTIYGMIESVWLWYNKEEDVDIESVGSQIATLATRSVAN